MNNQILNPSSENRNIIQSYIFSNARSRFNIVQMRILYRLVEFAQCEIEGLLIKDNLTKLEHNLRHVDITLPVRSVMAPGSKHYEQVKKSFLEMQRIVCELYDSESRTWYASPILYAVRMKQGEGVVNFSVADFVWDAMLDFTHGYRQYELSTVLNLKSANSMRMYTLLSGQVRPIYYTFEQLRGIFGVGDKYKQTTDFIKKIIVPCKAELDARCPWTFTWAVVRDGRCNVGLTLYPVEQAEKKDQELSRKQLVSQVSSSLLFGDTYRYMRYTMGFEPKEINAHKALLMDATKELPDMMGFLSSIQSRRRKAGELAKGKGWIISAIKSELADFRKRVK